MPQSGSRGDAAQQTVRWRGTYVELRELTAVVERNCSCAAKSTDMPRATCAAHRMLWQDQRALNGLVFERHIADRLKREEFSASSALIDSAPTASRARNAPLAKPWSRVTPMLAGVVLVVLGVGVLCAENAWLIAAAYPSSSLIAVWMSMGVLLIGCGAVVIGVAHGAHVKHRFRAPSDAVPIGPSATGPDAPESWSKYWDPGLRVVIPDWRQDFWY